MKYEKLNENCLYCNKEKSILISNFSIVTAVFKIFELAICLTGLMKA